MSATKQYNPLYILSRNGWSWIPHKKDYLSTTDDLYQYKAEILGRWYHSTVVALVSGQKNHLCFNGHYGVMWLEAIYDCERGGCFSYGDIEDMQAAIIHAEENLLKIGMPFTKGYKFHGKNAANKSRRNEKLRRMYKLTEKEEEDTT